MNVLHVYSGNLFGGVERFLLILANGRSECPQMAPSFALSFDGPLARELRAAGHEPYLTGIAHAGRPWTVWRARRSLRSQLAKGSWDIVVCHSAWSLALFGPVVSLRGIPLVFFVHDCQTGRHWTERLARRVRVNAILCNSYFVAKTVESAYPGHQPAVVHLPVPPPPPSAPGQRARIRARLGAPDDAIVIVIASRFERWKGHALLLESLALLPRNIEWRCWIAGGAQRPREAEYRVELEGLAAQASLDDRVQFLGQRTDIPELLAAADIYCQPNTGPEPFGISFVEALHAGLPVVTTRMGAATEILSQDCARLVPPDRVAVAGVLAQLSRDPALLRLLGAAAPVRAKQISDVSRRLADIASVLSIARASPTR